MTKMTQEKDPCSKLATDCKLFFGAGRTQNYGGAPAEKSCESPDWKDDGRVLNLVAADGSQVTGTLCYDDFVSDGEGDEYPIWNVRFDNGEEHCLWNFESWSFADPDARP